MSRLVRPARPDEADLLSAIARASKAHWGYSTEAMAAWRDGLTITRAAIERHPTFVCEDASRPIGFAQLVTSDGAWHLEHLWVLPDAIGHGAGRRLLRHAADHAAGNGAARLHIDSEPYAEAFYVACGARRVAVLPAPLAGDEARCRPQMVIDITAVRSTIS